jgi:hypothetical protein
MMKPSIYFLLLNLAFIFILVVANKTKPESEHPHLNDDHSEGEKKPEQENHLTDHLEEYSIEQHGHAENIKRNHSAPAVMSDHERKNHQGHEEEDKRNHSASGKSKSKTKKILTQGAKFMVTEGGKLILKETVKAVVPGQFFFMIANPALRPFKTKFSLHFTYI